MLHELNIKIIGDLWDNQDYHDNQLQWFRDDFERMLDTTGQRLHIHCNFNYEYEAETRKFRLISYTANLKGAVSHMLEVNHDFKKKYL